MPTSTKPTLAGDIIVTMPSGRYLQNEEARAGSPQAQRIQILRGMDVESKKWHARKLAGIKQD